MNEHLVENCGSPGSPLHKGDDGIWYAYAAWNSDDERQNAFPGGDIEWARKWMSESILEKIPEIVLEVVIDRLK